MDAQGRVVESTPSMLTRRQQTWGAFAVLAVALFYAAALPVISQASTTEGIEPGAPIPVGDAMTVVPAAGWELADAGQILVTLTKGAAAFGVATAIPDTTDPETTLEQSVASLDVDASWALGDESSLTTSAGYEVATIAAHSSQHVIQIWVVSDGDMSTTIVAEAPADEWVSYQEELAEMVDSVRFLEPA